MTYTYTKLCKRWEWNYVKDENESKKNRSHPYSGSYN